MNPEGKMVGVTEVLSLSRPECPTRFEILAHEPTPLGMLCLRRREILSRPGTVVTELLLDQELLMSSDQTHSERALARRALECFRGKDAAVLIGGLGLGYTAREALSCRRVGRVEVVEYLPQVIRWLDEGLIPLAGELTADPRIIVVEGDIYGRLASEPGEAPHDIILVDVDHSPEEPLGPASAAFYSEQGVGRVRAHLNPGGILGVWSYTRHAPFERALERVFSEVWVEPVPLPGSLDRVTGQSETVDWLFLARC